MTPELLEEIKQLAEERLRVGDVLASHCLLLHTELKAAQEENERLKSLLARARGAIHDGFIGGEWAHLVFQRDSLPVAAHKEADEAEEVVREIAHLQGNAYGENNYWIHNYNQTKPLLFGEAYHAFSEVKEHVDDYKAVVAEHEESIRYWQSEARRIERERRQAQEENERLRETAKHTFTLDQITETMQTAISVCTGYSPPMPQRQRTRCKRPPICPSCRDNAVYISDAPSDSALPELRPMECLKCSHKWTAFFEQDEG